MTRWQICHQSGRVLFTTDNEVTARNREQFGWKVIEVDKSREQFDAWFNGKKESMKSCGLGMLHIRRAHDAAWSAWQASRAAIEIDLPQRIGAKATWQNGPHMFADDVINCLLSEGLTVKPANDIANGTGTE